jgi:hypothetical protein
MLKPDLYEAAKINDTEKVLRLLVDQVPPTFIDDNNGWTVRSKFKCHMRATFTAVNSLFWNDAV